MQNQGIRSRQSPPNQLRMQQIVTNQPHNQDMSFRDVRQILDEDEALPINSNIPQNVR